MVVDLIILKVIRLSLDLVIFMVTGLALDIVIMVMSVVLDLVILNPPGELTRTNQ